MAAAAKRSEAHVVAIAGVQWRAWCSGVAADLTLPAAMIPGTGMSHDGIQPALEPAPPA